MHEFCDKVRSLMAEYNISQKALAAKSGISEASISRYVSGELQPRMDILKNIAKVFGVTTSYLLGEEESGDMIDSFEETMCVVARNRSKLTDQQKTELIKVLFGGKY